MTKVTNWLSYTPRASANEPAVLQIFDQIGEDWFGGSGVSAKAFSDALQSVGQGHGGSVSHYVTPEVEARLLERLRPEQD